MTSEEVQDISPLGVYRIFWKSGGYSVGSIGMTSSGRKWMAPSNWTSTGETYPLVAVARVDGWGGWGEVDHVELIECVDEDSESSISFLRKFHDAVYSVAYRTAHTSDHHDSGWLINLSEVERILAEEN